MQGHRELIDRAHLSSMSIQREFFWQYPNLSRHRE